jgi:hypothetical protein
MVIRERIKGSKDNKKGRIEEEQNEEKTDREE